MTVLSLEVRAENARAHIEHSRQCLLLLVRESGPELAAMLVSAERPTETDLPEEGLTRNVRGLEVITRALAYLENAQAQLEMHLTFITVPRDPKPGAVQ